MNKTYNFRADTFFLPCDFDGMYDDWVDFPVELSDDEVNRLAGAYYKWYTEVPKEEIRRYDDEEVILHRYVPDIHAKVKEALNRNAPNIWGPDIIPHINEIDIYFPLDDVFTALFESVNPQEL
ncbi:MAG: hypothetical protein MJZ73_08725 [Bacteroidaceae bacterium]|nr:hypothetical protein [Bacteroidaceae bacterium]